MSPKFSLTVQIEGVLQEVNYDDDTSLNRRKFVSDKVEHLPIYDCNNWELYLQSCRLPTLDEFRNCNYPCIEDFDFEVTVNTCQKGLEYVAQAGEEKFEIPSGPGKQSLSTVRGALENLFRNQANVFECRSPLHVLLDFVTDKNEEQATRARKDVGDYGGCKILVDIIRRHGFCDVPVTTLGFRVLKAVAAIDENAIKLVDLGACKSIQDLVHIYSMDFGIVILGFEILCNVTRLAPNRCPSRERILDIGKITITSVVYLI
jgi:hypothetical protein